jgi:hypothetical protein
LQHDFRDVLTAHNFLRLLSPRLLPNDFTVQDVEGNASPSIFSVLAQLLADLTKMLKGYAVLISQHVQNAQRNNIFERIHAAKWQLSVLLRIVRDVEADGVPIAQLGTSNPSEPLSMLFAECSDDVASGAHASSSPRALVYAAH